MKRVYFLLNDLAEFDFQPLLRRYLADVQVAVGEAMPPSPQAYDLIVLWSYRRVLAELPTASNVILFHSSNLPEGRGWAPIYHSLAEGLEYYTISGLIAASEVDAGELLIKARFRIRDDHTASCLRRWDTEISLLLIREVLRRCEGRPLVGVEQVGAATYYPRRKPEDNEVPLEVPLGQLIGHLRACEPQHPAFFVWRGIKYYLSVEPAVAPEFPPDLEIWTADAAHHGFRPYWTEAP